MVMMVITDYNRVNILVIRVINPVMMDGNA